MLSSLIVEFSLVAGAHLLAVASPGPDFAIVLQQSIERGRNVAIWTSVGIGTGILIHVANALIGIDILLAHCPAAFDALKYAGAAYLFWLGAKALFAKKRTPENEPGETPPAEGNRESAHGPFLKGLTVNLLNPKAVLFIVGLFTAVSQETPLSLKIGYGIWMALVTIIWFVLVSFFFTEPRIRAVFLKTGLWFERIMGVFLIALAIRLATQAL